MNDSARIQAVTFDVGGTLIQPWPSVGHVYAEVAARHGVKNLSPEKINEQFRAAWRTKTNFNHTREDWAALVERTFAGLTQAQPSAAFFPELYERFGAADAWRVFDDVLPALDAVATAGIRLAVISNWDERLRPLLQQLKLADYFEAIAVSVKLASPNRRPLCLSTPPKNWDCPRRPFFTSGTTSRRTLKARGTPDSRPFELTACHLPLPTNKWLRCPSWDCCARIEPV